MKETAKLILSFLAILGLFAIAIWVENQEMNVIELKAIELGAP